MTTTAERVTTTHLIDPRPLADLLAGSAPVRVLDVRWTLAEPDGRPAYRAGHLPGAVLVDLDAELAAHGGAPTAGRHPLPDVADLQSAARRWGVRAGDTVVVYDDAAGQSAARAWWLLRWAGVADVRLLDGALAGWREAGLPLVTGDEPAPEPGDVVLAGGALPTLDADAAARQARDGLLLDARAGARYRGETEPVDPRPGHVPGAVSAPTAANVGPDGRLLPADALRARFADLGARADEPVGVYCGSGVTAAHEALALTVAGFTPVLYPGSWSAWSNDPARPAALGAAPGDQPEAATRTWTGPEGIAVRGTVVVLAGRGETPEVYERLGRRLATDAYRVVAVDDDPAAAGTVAALLADPALPAPRVLLGSDAGALTAMRVARRLAASATPGLDGVVLAGLPTRPGPLGAPWGGSWDAELAARTACPNHQGVLGRAARGGIDTGATSLGAGLLGTAVPGGVLPGAGAGVAPEPGTRPLGLPTLALHGGADPISPVDDALPAYRALGASVAVLDGVLHDVLNDVQHRSAAATVVLFLERLRLGADAPVIVRDATGNGA